MSEPIYLILVTAGVTTFLSLLGYFSVKFIEETQKNTLAIVSLTLTVQHLTEKLEPIPKMQDDLNELHNKVRKLGENI